MFFPKRTFIVILLITMLMPALPLHAATFIGKADTSIGAKFWNVLLGMTNSVTPKKKKKTMPRFSSAKEFDAYVIKLQAAQKEQQKKYQSSYKGSSFGTVMQFGMVQESSLASPSSDKSGSTPSITNNQELGVDEGDIVKAYKDFLVVLRRGRLFSIRISDQGKAVLTPITKINAYPDGLTGGGWYDEMLISGNKIIVVGYNYTQRATEIGLFIIDDAGEISHTTTYFLDSNDYYSSRNYASRLVDGKLIFYMPYYIFRNSWYGDDKRPEIKLPAMRKWIGGDKVTDNISILKKTDIFKPIQEDIAPALHTIVTCDLRAELNCAAKSILGPASRNFYVSPNAVYLWVTESTPWHVVPLLEESLTCSTPGTECLSVPKCLGGAPGTKCGGLIPRPYEPTAYIYRMDLHDGTTTVLRADGSPIDQFSFKEADGFLNVLVRSEGRGEAMWRSEKSTGDLALMRVPLATFSDKPTVVSKSVFTPLPEPAGYGFQNRFVGDYVLYGSGGAWWNELVPHTFLYAKKFAATDPVQTLAIPHSVDRIEALGNSATVIGSSGNTLKFSSITLGTTIAVADTYALERAAQGELRSHGFFYSQRLDGTGILGLPVRQERDPIASYSRDSAAILFLHVSAEKKFSPLGTLDGTKMTERDEDDQCVASCTDWYGNARPIFLGNRIFALMGYELVEGSVNDRSMKEITRKDYLRNWR